MPLGEPSALCSPAGPSCAEVAVAMKFCPRAAQSGVIVCHSAPGAGRSLQAPPLPRRSALRRRTRERRRVVCERTRAREKKFEPDLDTGDEWIAGAGGGSASQR